MKCDTIYRYDPVGNRLMKNDGGQITTCSYNAGNEMTLLTPPSGAPTTSTYDANGNFLTENAGGALTTYSWDYENRLTGVSSPSGTETYSYSADGMREEKVNSSGTVYYVRDGENVLIETDAGLVTQAHYTDFPGVWGGLASERRGGVSSFYGFDQQSNTRILVSPAGAVTDGYLYKAFGEELAVFGTTVNSLRFGGEVGYWRDEAERLYVRARHLRTDLGRWMSRDPLVDKGGINPYGFVRNRSTILYDPLGLISLQGIKHDICVGACYIDYGILTSNCAITLLSTLKECYEIIASCYLAVWAVCGELCEALCLGPENLICMKWCSRLCGVAFGAMILKNCRELSNICLSMEKCDFHRCTQNANKFLYNCLAHCPK